jgi:hypothetical protein
VYENRVLRGIFGPKRDEVTGEWRKLHYEELNDLYCSPNILVSSCQLAFSDYPDWDFSVLFPQLWRKCQGIPRKDGARSALFLINEPCCSMYFLCRLCCSMYCLCVNVYCTTATGWQPNYS